MGRRKKGRDIDGLVFLDKPVGCSSNAALQRARRAFDARKAGHTGSLDPLASGLLPVCFGEATKLSSYLLHADKYYRVTARHGFETTTGDREGEPTRYSETPLPDPERIQSALERFIGPQTQIPPMYSALKHEGKRLYELAREGLTVEREPRDIVVGSITWIGSAASTFTLDLQVSGGTYVRTLVEDMARSWHGAAHVDELRRTAIGTLDGAKHLVSLDELERCATESPDVLDRYLWPVSAMIAQWPRALLSRDAALAIRQGQRAAPLETTGAADALMRLDTAEGGSIGIGWLDENGCVVPKRLFARTQH